MKYKNGVTIVNAFQRILKSSNERLNKIWVDKRDEFYNDSFKTWLQEIDIEIYSTLEKKYVVAERFIRTVKNKTYKYMTSASKKYVY